MVGRCRHRRAGRPPVTRLMLIRLTPLDLRRARPQGRHGTEFSTRAAPVLSGRNTEVWRRSGAAERRTLAMPWCRNHLGGHRRLVRHRQEAGFAAPIGPSGANRMSMTALLFDKSYPNTRQWAQDHPCQNAYASSGTGDKRSPAVGRRPPARPAGSVLTEPGVPLPHRLPSGWS